jgi:hypothetical protein
MIEIADAYPITRVQRVVNKFERNEIDGQSIEFPPKVPQWTAALKAEKPVLGEPDFETLEQYRQRMIEQSRVVIPRRSEAERARMLARLAEYRSQRRH